MNVDGFKHYALPGQKFFGAQTRRAAGLPKNFDTRGRRLQREIRAVIFWGHGVPFMRLHPNVREDKRHFGTPTKCLPLC